MRGYVFGVLRGWGVALDVTAHLHEREAQEIETQSLIGIVDLVVILGQTNTPNPIDRTYFDKDAITGLLQKLPKFEVLHELGLIGSNDDEESVLKPSGFIEAAHLSTQGFGGTRVASLKNLLFDYLIAEE